MQSLSSNVSEATSINDLLALASSYAKGIWTYRWIALAIAWIVCALGWSAVYSLPDVYEASARFYVDASSRLRSVVRSLGMEPDVRSRVFLVQQAMMARPQLEGVARESDLDLAVTSPSEYEQLINALRRDIRVSTGRGNEGQNLFTISYQHNDRDTATQVVDALLNRFTTDILELKDSDTERAEEFLQDQLGYYRDLLEDTERQLQAFKREHPSYVIGDRGDYFARLQEQQTLLDELESERQVEASKQTELQRQLANVDPHARVDGASEISATLSGNETSRRIRELQQARRSLLLRVTEQHPDVKAITEQIRELRAELESELAAMAEQSRDGAPSATNPVYIEIQIALSNSNLKLAELERKIAQTRAKVSQLRDEVDRAPALERQYTQLTRDYANYQQLYNEVLNKSERERIGRVGDEKDVVSFNVIDPTRASLRPVGPNRPLLLAGVLVVGIAVGGGVAFLLCLLRPTFQASEDLAASTALPVLGSVSLDFALAGVSRFGSFFRFGAATIALLLAFAAAVLFQEQAARLVQQLVQQSGLV